jgi:hypothetical protein
MQRLDVRGTVRGKREASSRQGWPGMRKCAARAFFLGALGFALHDGGFAYSQTTEVVAEHSASAQARPLQPVPPLSKFEARRIRHRCRDEAPDSAQSKELRHCFEMHVAARRLWGDCKRKAQLGELHGHERDEAVKQCVTEKLASSRQGRP